MSDQPRPIPKATPLVTRTRKVPRAIPILQPLALAKPAPRKFGILAVKAWVTPLAFLARGSRVIIELDGDEFHEDWGIHEYEVRAGFHVVRVWFKYMANPMCGLNEIEIEVSAGRTTRVLFSMPPLMTARGELIEVRSFSG